jgi:hypothetical protein
MRWLLPLLLALAAISSQAAERYVRQGASGNGSGSDWANAYTALPSSLNRGDTYYFADGTYGGRTFSDNASGTTPITIKKCTAADHGTEVGYNAAYCDGKATINGTWAFTRPHYVIDGATRNEANWKDHAAYGFTVSGGFRASRLDGGHVGGDCSADNITIRNVHVGNTSTSYASSNGQFYIAGFGGGSVACENWTISRVLAQNVEIGIQCAGCKGLLVEHSYWYIGWAKESIRGQVHASDMTVRWSIFEDSCQKDPADATSGCTAEIGIWDGGDGAFDNVKIYGNVFYKTTSEHNSDAVILVGGGPNWAGSPTNNSLAYNNTIAGYQSGSARIQINGGSGNTCRNNVWYGVSSAVGTGASCNTSTSNVTLTGTPFINYAGGNFQLSAATVAGVALPSPYNTDLRGIARGGDGTWDLGAYEYGGGAPVPLPVPLGLRVLQ